VQDPSLEGNSAGVLALTFDQPTTVLEFGIPRSCIYTLTQASGSSCSNPGLQAARPVTRRPTSPFVSFSKALFSYSGPAVHAAVITFPSSGFAPRIALDDLKFH
jgi:hypothetical protein